MKSYTIKKVTMEEINEQVWSNIPSMHIECYPWCANNYRPKTEVKIIYNSAELRVRFISFEKNIEVKYFKNNDPVFKDSCVEFFFNPLPEIAYDYINFEINAKGTYLLQVGTDKINRQFIKEDTSAFKINNHVVEGDYWCVEFSIPFDFIEKYCGKIDFKSGDKIKGNFYKCGDETVYPHYGCWNEIISEVPNFHIPQFFGELILE